MTGFFHGGVYQQMCPDVVWFKNSGISYFSTDFVMSPLDLRRLLADAPFMALDRSGCSL
jgi:hypothetical protein